jgi:hypothetical protein
VSRRLPLLLVLAAAGAGCEPATSAGRAPVAADAAGAAGTEGWEPVADLGGPWLFRIGDDPAWALPAATAGWERIAAPAAWEDEGFWGYDGFAWYQKRFALPPGTAGRVGPRPLYLRLGRVDDVDEVYLNGRFLGSTGRVPPSYETAYLAPRLYRIPPGYLDPAGENVLAVRVFDAELSGGLIEGPLDLAVPPPDDPRAAPMVADLAGAWRLGAGDNADRAAPGFDDGAWAEVTVPARWDPQGFADLDGYAWYRRRFTLSAADARRDLVLVLGAVDDLDQAFVNGVRVGQTGDVEGRVVGGDEWMRPRAYPVPAAALRPGENVVAVRVFDGLLDGGLYAGPVGLMTAEAYADLRRRAEAGEGRSADALPR